MTDNRCVGDLHQGRMQGHQMAREVTAVHG